MRVSSSRAALSIPPLAHRIAAGRPVLARTQMQDLVGRIMDMTTTPTAEVKIAHTACVATRLANGQVLSGDDGDTLTIRISVGFGGDPGQRVAMTRLQTNQLSLEVLRAIVDQAEAIDREQLRPKENVLPVRKMVQDTYVPVQLWHQATIDAMRNARATTLPRLLLPFRKAGLTAAGFVGLIARSEGYYDRDGITAYCEETDSEVTVTARGSNGESGWSGQAARDWSKIDLSQLSAHALEMAQRSANPVAVEPGRRTAVLSAAAVGQITRQLAGHFNQYGSGAFERAGGAKGIRWGGRYFDPRITIRSDPADPDGGYRPFFDGPYATPAMTWIENGILKNMSSGLMSGKPYVDTPRSLRIFGGPTTEAEMIARCEEGIYVNRLYGVQDVERHSALMTGVTRDGCFLIQKGKITKPLKNFRILESPFFIWNKLEAIGPTSRVPIGFLPKTYGVDWPVPPIIAPPMMVHDFNFASLADAV